MQLPKNKRAYFLIPYLSLAASMSLVGIYVGLSKPLTFIFPVALLAWLRYTIAGIAMVGWFKRAKNESPLSVQNFCLLALSAFIGSFLFTLCMLTGVKYACALSAGIIMAGMPATVALLSRIFLKERISMRTVYAIVCAISGIALLAIANVMPHTQPQITRTPADHSGWMSLWGHLLLIVAVFCEASYVVIGKKLAGQVSPKRISFYLNLWGWIFTAPLGIYLALQFDFASVSPGNWGLLFFYAISASIVTVWLWMKGLKSVPASSAGIFTIMLPVCTTLVGIVLGEHFTLMHGIAFVLALFSVVLGTWNPHHSNPASKAVPQDTTH